MALSIADLRAKINASQRKTNNGDSSSIFSFSKLQPGDTIKIRFVDDGEPNDFFWRPRSTRSLKFDSIRLADGSIVENRTYVDVPAFNIKKGDVNLSNLPENYLYSSTEDVINQKIKPFWDGTDEGKKLYNRFSRTERYVFQGFVRGEGYETKLYRFIINKDLFNIIYSFISDEEICHTPSDIEHGRDFILKVTKKIANINGKPQEVKDYATSKWSNTETSLTEDEKAWLSENKPFVLKDFIPSRPTAVQEEAMVALFNASYNGEPYDVNSWLKIFRPNNVFFDENGNIKDLKNGSNQATTVAREIPSQVQVQPQPQVQPQVTVNSSVNGLQLSAEQLQALLASANVQPQVQATAPVTETVEKKLTAPQLIEQNSQTISGSNPQDVIQGILSNFNIQQNN